MTTKEEVLRLAKAAGFQQVTFDQPGFTGILAGQNLEPEITKLIKLAKAQGAAEEREACAKIFEERDEDGDTLDAFDYHAKDYAGLIRNRERKG